ncbi:hypothetical protein [Salmonella phage SSBI34]|nr:hypothetical protein [Salmonella phage SSBI34]
MLEMMSISIPKRSESGQENFETPGVFDFVVPANIDTLKILCIGGGGGGSLRERSSTGYLLFSSGSGGSISYSNNVRVAPGSTLRVSVPEGWPNRTNNAVTGWRRGRDAVVYGPDQAALVLAKGGDSLTSNIGEVSFTGGDGFNVTQLSLPFDLTGGNAASLTYNGANGGRGSFSSGWGTLLDGRGGRPNLRVPGLYGGGSGFVGNFAQLAESAPGAIRIMWDAPGSEQRSFPNNMEDV